jgi:hypothetical protein
VPDEELTFSQDENGLVYKDVEPWPQTITITTALVEQADPVWLTVGEGVIEFDPVGERAVYRVDEMTPDVWRCSLYSVERPRTVTFEVPDA